MSDKINDGGPAFPQDKNLHVSYEGLTIRDWFAGMALTGTIAFPIPGQEKIPDIAARDCYAYSDAMLKAREVKSDG